MSTPNASPLETPPLENEGDWPPAAVFPETAYPHLFRLMHWVLTGAVPVLAATGLSLHATARPGWSLFSGVLPAFFWPGRVGLIHLCAAAVFVPALAVGYWAYWERSRPWRITHVLLLGSGLASVAGGALLLVPTGPSAVYAVARLVHAVSGLVVLPIVFVWHMVEGFAEYRHALIPAFHPWSRPRLRGLVWLIVLPLVSVCLIVNGLPVRSPWRRLAAVKIDQQIDTEENPASLPWDEAAPLTIELANGSGFDRGRTRVTLQALHDGRDLAIRAEWSDPTEDRRYTPWKKTVDGWEHLVTGPEDENVYYEDKFALIFPTRPDWQFERFGCAAECHVGGGRPYGYKGGEGIIDVWHWKAARTDPLGQADDKYWSEVDFSPGNEDVGRHGDPKEEGTGYEKNVSADDPTHPPYLFPDDRSARVQAAVQGVILKSRRVPYSPEAAKRIPEGALVPGIIVSAFAGDRADVRCTSRYGDGRWTLYLRRRLDTGSRYDVKFAPGQSHPFACAAFDHSSGRHAYGLSVYWLTLEE